MFSIFYFLFISYVFFFSSLILLPREVEDFPRGGNHSKYMPPLTYLAWLQPICYNSRFIFIHINITKSFNCGGNFDKFFFFFSGSVFEKIIFFQVQFLKIFFFQVWFLKILFFSRSSFWKCYFFAGSVLENKIVKQISNHTDQSATIKTQSSSHTNQQP